jgi:hypothetical protein
MLCAHAPQVRRRAAVVWAQSLAIKASDGNPVRGIGLMDRVGWVGRSGMGLLKPMRAGFWFGLKSGNGRGVRAGAALGQALYQ